MLDQDNLRSGHWIGNGNDITRSIAHIESRMLCYNIPIFHGFRTLIMRLTVHQQHVLDALRQTQRPLSAYALLDMLRQEGFAAPIQVYRALERLIEHRLVHRLESLNAYVSCSRSHNEDMTAFAICDNCGHIDELVDTTLSKSLQRLAKTRSFSPACSTIEIHGRCAACTGLA